jgi:hypothetical protein
MVSQAQRTQSRLSVGMYPSDASGGADIATVVDRAWRETERQSNSDGDHCVKKVLTGINQGGLVRPLSGVGLRGRFKLIDNTEFPDDKLVNFQPMDFGAPN